MTHQGAATSLAQRVTAVVPVKSLAHAKSRLALPSNERRALALAFAVDTIEALSASPLVGGVLVVTSDAVVVRRMQQLGVRVTRETGTGLARALHDGLRVAATWRPGSGVAIVPADLPCLRPEDVTRLLADPRTDEGAFVPDRSTTGTTLVIHPPGSRMVTSYGPGSAARHRDLGLHALTDAPLRARHDVDTLEDLRQAGLLGPGPETIAVLDAVLDAVTAWRISGVSVVAGGPARDLDDATHEHAVEGLVGVLRDRLRQPVGEVVGE